MHVPSYDPTIVLGVLRDDLPQSLISVLDKNTTIAWLWEKETWEQLTAEEFCSMLVEKCDTGRKYLYPQSNPPWAHYHFTDDFSAGEILMTLLGVMLDRVSQLNIQMQFHKLTPQQRVALRIAWAHQNQHSRGDIHSDEAHSVVLENLVTKDLLEPVDRETGTDGRTRTWFRLTPQGLALKKAVA